MTADIPGLSQISRPCDHRRTTPSSVAASSLNFNCKPLANSCEIALLSDLVANETLSTSA
eukprot:762919-Hanusia_phi.AAC.3